MAGAASEETPVASSTSASAAAAAAAAAGVAGAELTATGGLVRPDASSGSEAVSRLGPSGAAPGARHVLAGRAGAGRCDSSCVCLTAPVCHSQSAACAHHHQNLLSGSDLLMAMGGRTPLCPKRYKADRPRAQRRVKVWNVWASLKSPCCQLPPFSRGTSCWSQTQGNPS